MPIYIYIYRLITKIRLTMLCLSGFELYSRWVPLKLDLLGDLIARYIDAYSSTVLKICS